MAILQVFQAKLLRSLDESGPDDPAFCDLRSATDLALRATKATAQAIGRSMASLVVLEHHLWLNLTEIKEADKVAFLDARFPRRSLRTRRRGIHGALHRGSEVVPGHATLPA
ncbi:MAG: hypothetical protein ACRC0L_01055 [Angustibacter sp.]